MPAAMIDARPSSLAASLGVPRLRAACHAGAPVLARLADEHRPKLVEVDLDEEEQPLGERHRVLLSIVSMILFENGEPNRQAINDLRERRTS
jgi:thiol-disulfide isomerase/thioredoxin